MPDIIGVDFVSWIVSAIWVFAVGALWFAPPVFGRLWARLQGMPTEMTPEMRKRAVPGYVAAIVSALAVSFLIGFLISNFGYLAYDGIGLSHNQYGPYKVGTGGIQATSWNDPNGGPGALISLQIAGIVWAILALNGLVMSLFKGQKTGVWLIDQTQNLVAFLGVGLIFNYIHT
ncbi:MAG: DUF1761 domain-containing protein [Thermoplasmatota archaeon]